MRIARLIAALVKQDVSVLITTHSEFILNAFSNCIKASSLPEAKRSALGIPASQSLVPAKVGVYLFKMQEGVSKSVALQVTEDGIPDDEFLKTHEALHDQSVGMDRLKGMSSD